MDCLSANQIKPLICMVLIRYAGTKYMVYRGPLETRQDRLELARTENAASEEATGEGSRRSYGYIRRTGWHKKSMDRKTLWTRDQVGVEERLNYYRKEDFEPQNYFVLYSLCRFRCIKEEMADRQGFEPWRRSPAYTLSRRAPSTTRPPVRGVRFSLNRHPFARPPHICL